MNFKERNFSELSLIFSFLLFIFFIPISVSLSHIFLTLSILSLIYFSLTNKKRIKIQKIFVILSVFAIFEIISTIFSINIKASMDDLKEILLFLIVPLTFNLTQKKEDFKIFNCALSFAIFLSAILSFLEYSEIIMGRERASGFLSHYMTQSGILMLFAILSLSMTFYEKGKKKFLWLFLFLLSIFSLILTLTRSAWIGLIFGLLFITILFKPRLLIFFLILGVLIAFVSPESVKKRFISTFDPKDETVKERIYMTKAGLKIILKYPIFGTGLDTAKITYKKFKPPEAVRDVPHLHSNILQIGAELGIPALAVWLLFIILSLLDNYKVWKSSSEGFTKFSGLAGVGVITSLFIAGLFEFNFGDSEVKMLFLYLITYPLALWEIERNEHKKS